MGGKAKGDSFKSLLKGFKKKDKKKDKEKKKQPATTSPTATSGAASGAAAAAEEAEGPALLDDEEEGVAEVLEAARRRGHDERPRVRRLCGN